MLRHTLLLLFLYGIRSSSGRPQNDLPEAREKIQNPGIKKSEVGANGSGAGEAVLQNFRNPVLEYLSSKDRDSTRRGILREIRHGQTLFVPLGSSLISLVPDEQARPARDPDKDPATNFYEYVNKAGMPGVTSPVLHLNRSETRGEWTKTETFPAAGVVVSTYNADGTLKSSVTHFRPLGAPPTTSGHAEGNPSLHKINWPLAGYFPIVINDPFLAAYNGIASSMYNTFSSVIEYGPEADICHGSEVKNGRKKGDEFDEITLGAEVKLIKPTTDKSPEKIVEGGERRRRDATGIIMNLKNGDRVNLEVEEPEPTSDVLIPVEAEERTRAHSVMLVNPPPLSSIARPSHTGFNIKKKGSKPQRPDKEGEGTSEEVGEEVEDTTSQSGPTDGVAISPPPDGASVAEAKPVGLAIAGPGGVAAAKPQGTAVAGPGGLAIARPIGTAIAGVEVEGAVPIGGQQKNKKKKPKQDAEKMDDEMDTELHYVGGLTGPIGNPQPNTKDFGKASATAKSRDQENLLIQGNKDKYQLRLEEQDGKYGLFPFMVSPLKGVDRIQKRMDTPTFFHGLLGSRDSPQQSQPQFYHNFYY